MPHVIVKMYTGRSEAVKITRAVTKTLGDEPDAVSVGIEDVAPRDWAAQVFTPDIPGGADRLYNKPGNKLSDLPS